MLFNRPTHPPCPKCGGFVGSHSDICHDCGYSPGLGWLEWVVIATFILLMAAALCS